MQFVMSVFVANNFRWIMPSAAVMMDFPHSNIITYIVTNSGEIEVDDDDSQKMKPTMEMVIHNHGQGCRSNGGEVITNVANEKEVMKYVQIEGKITTDEQQRKDVETEYDITDT